MAYNASKQTWCPMNTDKVSGFRAQIEDMIAADRLGDAIESLLVVAHAAGCLYRNELIAHMGDLQRLDRAARLGLSAVQNAEDRRRLRFVLLELLEEVLRNSRNSDLPVFQAPVAAEVPDQAALEKIIGSNNLKNIAWLEVGLQCSMAVGRIVTPEGIGTGFLIHGRLIVTNHHVLPTADIAGRSVVNFNYQQDVRGQMLEHFTYTLEAGRFASSCERDVTVVGVKQAANNPDLQSWGRLEINETKEPAVGNHVSIIQHPNGGPKQIACTANQVVNIYEHRLQYLTDTLPGSSGAPVFDDDWTVIAVHHAGGNLKSNSRGETRYVNEGILTTSIREYLSGLQER